MELLMPARRCGIALRTTFIFATFRVAAITYEVFASDDAVFTCASPARIFLQRPSVAVVDFTVFEPTAYKYNNNIVLYRYFIFFFFAI